MFLSGGACQVDFQFPDDGKRQPKESAVSRAEAVTEKPVVSAQKDADTQALSEEVRESGRPSCCAMRVKMRSCGWLLIKLPYGSCCLSSMQIANLRKKYDDLVTFTVSDNSRFQDCMGLVTP